MLSLRCFHWIGRSSRSAQVTGRTYAYSHAQFKQLTAAQGVTVNRVIEAKVSGYYRLRFGIKTNQIHDRLHQLITLLDSGFSVAAALKQLQKEEVHAEMEVMIHHLRQDILSGQTLSQSLSRFNSITTEIIEYASIGESNGQLPESLGWALEQSERKANIRKKIRAALAYPTVILLVAVVVLIVMLIFVLPQFESLFSSFGAELPQLTKLTLSLSTWMQKHLFSLMLITGAMLWALYLVLSKSDGLRHELHRYLLHVPILGTAITAGEWARFSLVLSSCLKAGLPITQAWQNAISILGNSYLRARLDLVKQRIKDGNSIANALQGTPTLPENLGVLIHVGESTGRLAPLLERAANQLEQQLIDTTDNLGKMIEPFIILILGVMVGTLVLSIYLPIFSLMNSLH